MAVKTNYTKGKSKYYRVSAVLGRDCNGKKIIKEFYGKSKSEAEEKKNKYLTGVADGISIDIDNISVGELMRMWLFEVRRVSDKLKPSSFEINLGKVVFPFTPRPSIVITILNPTLKTYCIFIMTVTISMFMPTRTIITTTIITI